MHSASHFATAVDCSQPLILLQLYTFLTLSHCYRCSLHSAPHFATAVDCTVECTLVQTLRLCTGPTAHRGSRGIDLLFLDHGTRRGWGVSVTPRPLFTPGKDPVPILQEAGWAPESVWAGAENLASIGIRSPDRPSRSQSLYRLSYPAQPRDKANTKALLLMPDAQWQNTGLYTAHCLKHG